MSEKMINDMIQRMEELRDGKHGKVEELTFHRIMMHVFDIAKVYAVDKADVLNFRSAMSLMGSSEPTLAEVKALNETEE